jgi:hypothetical protein
MVQNGTVISRYGERADVTLFAIHNAKLKKLFALLNLHYSSTLCLYCRERQQRDRETERERERGPNQNQRELTRLRLHFVSTVPYPLLIQHQKRAPGRHA